MSHMWPIPVLDEVDELEPHESACDFPSMRGPASALALSRWWLGSFEAPYLGLVLVASMSMLSGTVFHIARGGTSLALPWFAIIFLDRHMPALPKLEL